MIDLMTEQNNPQPSSTTASEPEGLQELLSGAATADTLAPKQGRRPRYLPPTDDGKKKSGFSIPILAQGSNPDSYGQSDPVQTSLFALEGRMGRLSLLAGLFVLCIYAFLASLLGVFIFAMSSGSLMAMATGHGLGAGFLYMIVAGLAGLALYIMLYVKRLHDINLSGFWILLPVAIWLISGMFAVAGLTFIALLASLLNGLLGIVILLIPGTAGDNRFGPIRYTSGVEQIMGCICGVFLALVTVFKMTHHHSAAYVSPFATSSIPGLNADQQARYNDALAKMTPEQRAQMEENMKKIQEMGEQLRAQQAAQSGQAASTDGH
jgi:uncharacterized membrane protein YhaH (DUF805 family)